MKHIINKIFIILCIFLIIGCTDKNIHTSLNMNINKTGPNYIYPNSTLTPGDVLTTDINKICTPGYSASVRDVNEKEKEQVYKEYGIVTHQPYEYEIDHLISLELGGSNNIKNLWPERYVMIHGAREKDKVENYLHKLVCENGLDIKVAQQEIATDWYYIYLNMN